RAGVVEREREGRGRAASDYERRIQWHSGHAGQHAGSIEVERDRQTRAAADIRVRHGAVDRAIHAPRAGAGVDVVRSQRVRIAQAVEYVARGGEVEAGWIERVEQR